MVYPYIILLFRFGYCKQAFHKIKELSSTDRAPRAAPEHALCRHAERPTLIPRKAARAVDRGRGGAALRQVAVARHRLDAPRKKAVRGALSRAKPVESHHLRL